MARLSEIRVPIIFKENTGTVNDEGGLEESYTPVLTTVAAVNSKSQTRSIKDAIDGILEADEVIVRNLDLGGLNKDWIVEYDGLDHTIHSIKPFGLNRSQWIQLITKAKK
jgi:hypothetical protein